MKNFTAILEGVAVSIIENVCKRIGLVDIINHLAGNCHNIVCRLDFRRKLNIKNVLLPVANIVIG